MLPLSLKGFGHDEVERFRKMLPKGDWNWEGSTEVSQELQRFAYFHSVGGHDGCKYEHIRLMAVLGCGDETTCKEELKRQMELWKLS